MILECNEPFFNCFAVLSPNKIYLKFWSEISIECIFFTNRFLSEIFACMECLQKISICISKGKIFEQTGNLKTSSLRKVKEEKKPLGCFKCISIAESKWNNISFRMASAHQRPACTFLIPKPIDGTHIAFPDKVLNMYAATGRWYGFLTHC